MPGTSPGMTNVGHPRLASRTSEKQGVDARNESGHDERSKAWMPGTSPGMTKADRWKPPLRTHAGALALDGHARAHALAADRDVGGDERRVVLRGVEIERAGPFHGGLAAALQAPFELGRGHLVLDPFA